MFLDRDGTIIFDEGYISDSTKVALIPGVANSLRKLSDAGYLLVIITNQSGIGRNYFTEKEMHSVNNRMLDLLKKEKVFINKIYFCPHRPEDLCECRKPKPGLILKAAGELGINISVSAMVGDKISDVEAGVNAGCGCNFLISKNKTLSSVPGFSDSVVIVGSLGEVADILCSPK